MTAAHHTTATLPATVAVNRDDLLGLRNAARGLQLKPQQRGRSVLFGQHPSKFRGRGMDYLESRHYLPGDDVRQFDWRVTARTDQPHVKLFAEEREQPVVVLTDLSASMSLASQGAFKSVIAARMAALCGWIAVAQGDRIGGLIYRDEHNHRELKPLGGRRGVIRLVEALVQLGQPHRQFDNRHAGIPCQIMQRLQQAARPGTQLVLISDFFSITAQTRQYLQQMRQHCNVFAVQIIDPLELVIPPNGRYGISDGAHSWLLDLDSRTRRQDLGDALSSRQHAIDALFDESGIPLLRLSTGDDVAAVLHQVMTRKPASHKGNLLMPRESAA